MGVTIQFSVGQITQVALQAFTQAEDQLRPIPGLAQCPQVSQTVLYQFIFVKRRYRVGFPDIHAFHRIKFGRVYAPRGVVGAAVEQFVGFNDST